MDRESQRLRLKTWLFAALVVLSNSVGNFVLSFGMKRLQPQAGLPGALLEPLLSPWVIGGIVLLILWTLARMALLSWADLSFVLPVTSVGYALTAFLGFLFLAEKIETKHWVGIGLITAGAVFTGRSQPSSTTVIAGKRGGGA